MVLPASMQGWGKTSGPLPHHVLVPPERMLPGEQDTLGDFPFPFWKEKICL